MPDDKIYISRRKHEEVQKENERLRQENERLKEEKQKFENKERELEEQKRELEEKKKELEKKNKDLEDQLARVLGSAPFLAASEKTAEAGGMPTSKIFYRRNRTEGEKKHTGGQPGHPGHARKRPIPNAPSLIVVPEKCPGCNNPVCLNPIESAEQRRTITDIPVPSELVYEVVYQRGWCPVKRKLVRGSVPWLPPNQEFGPFVACWISYERMLGLSIEKVQSNLLETFGMKMSEALVLKLEKWVADSLKGEYEKVRQEILKAKALGGDETKLRINGMNGWMWVFTSVMEAYYKIAPTRGHTVPETVLKGYKGGLTRDAWKPYDVLEEVIHQLDLLHVNRWLERGEIKHRIEPRTLLSSKAVKLTGPGRPPEECIEFADGIRAILKEPIVFTEREPLPTMTERKKMYKHCRKKLKAFLERDWTDADAVRISKELRARFDMIFPFIIHPEISWNNNDAERGIRKGVLHRKVSGGRRTWSGAGVLERLLTISETAKKRGRNIIESFQNALQIGRSPSSTS
jgi:transposase